MRHFYDLATFTVLAMTCLYLLGYRVLIPLCGIIVAIGIVLIAQALYEWNPYR